MSNFFTYAERISLQKFLGEGLTFKEIARTLGKDPSTISREVRKHMSQVATGRPGYPYNPCKHRKSCRAKNLCSRGDCHRQSVQYCKLCPDCSKHCPDFLEEICSSRFKVPYVCNGCGQIGKCTLMKNIYDAEHAQYKAHDVISQSRSGLCTSEDEISRLNALISPLVRRGQSLHQIYITHQNEIMCSEKTLYNYLDANLFDVTNGDLPRKARLRPRKQKKEYKVDKGCRPSRSLSLSTSSSDGGLKVGCRLVVDEMKDPAAVAPGSQGTFEGYDGAGDLLMAWDSGSSLKLIDGVDKFHVVSSGVEIETSIAHEKELQEKTSRDDEFECPRCGRKALYRSRALSRIADISVCEGCGTIEAIIAARAGGLNINITGANADTARDFKRVGLRDWKMVRCWMGLEDID